jgi:hypothetical protein
MQVRIQEVEAFCSCDGSQYTYKYRYMDCHSVNQKKIKYVIPALLGKVVTTYTVDQTERLPNKAVQTPLAMKTPYLWITTSYRSELILQTQLC